MELRICPECGSKKIKRNGHIHNGKQNHQCQQCGRQFVDEPEQRLISEETRNLLRKLLLERIPLRGICRTLGVSLRWLLLFIVQLFGQLPEGLNFEISECVSDVIIEVIDAEADELWSFVGKKENKQWVWIALDRKTRQVIAFHVGDRSKESAKALWDKIPELYRHKAMFHTDLLESYKGIIPPHQHQPISKLFRQTNHIERFNCTLRQRVSRLVRQALSFSKKLDNHIGAIKYFICHYNLSLQRR